MIRPAVPVRLLRAPLQPRQGPVVAAGIPVGVIGVFQAAARGQGPARLFRFAEFVQQAEVTFPGRSYASQAAWANSVFPQVDALKPGCGHPR